MNLQRLIYRTFFIQFFFFRYSRFVYGIIYPLDVHFKGCIDKIMLLANYKFHRTA